MKKTLLKRGDYFVKEPKMYGAYWTLHESSAYNFKTKQKALAFKRSYYLNERGFEVIER